MSAKVELQTSQIGIAPDVAHLGVFSRKSSVAS